MFCPMMLVRRITRLVGKSAHHGVPAASARIWRATGQRHQREQPYPVHRRRNRPASHDRLLNHRRCSRGIPSHSTGRSPCCSVPTRRRRSSVAEVGRHFQNETSEYWRTWVSTLSIPFEWQDAVIRAAITLKLNAFDDTGAIVAAMTTSVPEAPNSGRNWDYRYCWLRDAYFVINALNRLGTVHTMESYLRYSRQRRGRGQEQPAASRSIASADGRWVTNGRGGPRFPAIAAWVRCGLVTRLTNKSRTTYTDRQFLRQATYFSTSGWRVQRGGQSGEATRITRGNGRCEVFDQPDAGIWELRESVRVHTFSSVMCWAACDRLAKIPRRESWAGPTPAPITGRRERNAFIASFAT